MANHYRRPRGIVATFEMGDLVASFLSEYQYGASVNTFKWYRSQLSALLAWAATEALTDPAKVTPNHLRAFFIKSSETLSPSSVVDRYEGAHRFFAWCVEQGTLKESPIAKVRRPQAKDPDVMAFTPEEARRLVAHAAKAPGWLGKRDKAITTILFGTGARAQGLLGLTEESFDRKRHRVRLFEKGEKERFVPTGPKVEKALDEYLRVRPRHPDPSLWITQRLTVMNYSTLNAMLKHLGGYAGVDECRPHRFRHTAATELYRSSKNILLVKAFLGHSKVATTERYLKRLGVEFADANYATPDTWLA